MEGVTVYHAGTKIQGEGVVCNGGRVLAVTGVGANLQDAVAKAYAAGTGGSVYSVSLVWRCLSVKQICTTKSAWKHPQPTTSHAQSTLNSCASAAASSSSSPSPWT